MVKAILQHLLVFLHWLQMVKPLSKNGQLIYKIPTIFRQLLEYVFQNPPKPLFEKIVDLGT